MQQTPKPAAQFPCAEPLLEEHSEEVRQVLAINMFCMIIITIHSIIIDTISRFSILLQISNKTNVESTCSPHPLL